MLPRLMAACAVAVSVGCAQSAFVMRPGEAEVIVQLRVLISTEAAYSFNNGGRFDTVECLLDASRCLPSLSASAPRFLTDEFAFQVQGFRGVFHPGHETPKAALGPTMSKSSLEFYAYTMEPTVVGGRWFCGDNRPTLCYADRPLPVPAGQCPKRCKSILP